jgi:glycosyltransferase involved in cell wall biosynthesis
MQIIPPGFEPATPSQRRAARAAFGLRGSASVINVVSRLDGEKGLDSILSAVAKVRTKRDDFQVLVAGDGSLSPWFASEVRRLGLGETVHMIGRIARDDVLRLHHASDFHLYAGTISCGLSICLLEAMACGVIPIVSDVPRAQRSLVGDAGWVFPAGDAHALAESIGSALLTRGAQRERLRQAVLGRLQESPDPFFPELLDELLASQPNSDPRAADRYRGAVRAG